MMLNDPLDKRWQSEELNVGFDKTFQDKFQARSCLVLMREIAHNLRLLESELKKFDILLAQKREDESIREAIKRLRKTFHITIDKSKHDRYIGKLRDWNSDLAALLHDHDTHTHDLRAAHVTIPANIETIRVASQRLHEALCRSWRCKNAAHPMHLARLCIQTRVFNEPQFKLAVACQDSSHDHDTVIRNLQAPSFWLYVDSLGLSSTDTSKPVTANGATATISQTSFHGPSSGATSRRSRFKASAGDGVKKIHQRMAIRLSFSPKADVQVVSTETEPPIPLNSVSVAPVLQPMNLRRQDNMCQYIAQTWDDSNAAGEAFCLGYLEGSHICKHMFYLRPLEHSIVTQDITPTSWTLADAMREVREHELTHELRLRLAHRTASAMLTFHHTPWLCERWRLKHMHYLGSKHLLDETAIESLHLTSEIFPDHQPDPLDAETILNDKLTHGIENPSIFSLGLALLQIGRWELIEDQLCEQDQNNEILAARRLVCRTSHLGPKYEELTRRCLQCNFGCSTELEDEDLKAALYNDVVRRLDALITLTPSP
ncbi:hypothetical protein OPT61_g4410 [Boeremia exigua]|uniref:Uncharacterized protein n=1 Tax=Boeremia exigua TaxID=749465 RepID=A0ACC2IEA5_9PLEO|nr:hypothetical protein OPT61_g4410 [Boeremia exigua]